MKRSIHVLHFKLDKEQHSALLKIAEDNKTSLSKTIVSIIGKFMPFIEKNQISFQDRESRYQVINNKKEKRRSILAYLPQEYYRKLKHLHHDLNVYSIAQIMRKLIRYFINANEKYGFKNLSMYIERIDRKWKEKKKILKDMGTMIQLFNKNHLPASLTVSYDLYSRPISYKFPKTTWYINDDCFNFNWGNP